MAGIITRVMDRQVVVMELRSRTVLREVHLGLPVEAMVRRAARDPMHEDMTRRDSATRAWHQIQATAVGIGLRRGTIL